MCYYWLWNQDVRVIARCAHQVALEKGGDAFGQAFALGTEGWKGNRVLEGGGEDGCCAR
jgi:hypothetical protein